jgi:hypothetical protein
MASIDVRLGYDGKCAVHRTMNTIFRRTEHDLQTIRSPQDTQLHFVNLIEVHCAAGHQYYAIDLDQMIPDPFTPEETAATVVAHIEEAEREQEDM